MTTVPIVLRQQCPISYDNSAQCTMTTVPNVLRQQCPMYYDNSAPCTASSVASLLRILSSVISQTSCPLSHRSEARYHLALWLVITLLRGSCLPVNARTGITLFLGNATYNIFHQLHDILFFSSIHNMINRTATRTSTMFHIVRPRATLMKG